MSNSHLQNEYENLTKEKLIDEAKKYLNNTINPDEEKLDQLIGELVKNDQFGYATELIIKKYNQEIPEREKQQFAKYIYKDHSLPSSIRFSKALEELDSLEQNGEINTCETYGLKGAIYKRRWEFDGQFRNLLIALKYYNQGYTLWQKFIDSSDSNNLNHKNSDFGYTAVNAAFVNELIAVEEIEQGDDAINLEDVKHYLKNAFDTRHVIIKRLADPINPGELKKEFLHFFIEHPKEDGVVDISFVYATLLEAYFGILDFKNATIVVKRIKDLPNITKWKKRSTAKQLIAIGDLQDKIAGLLTDEQKTDDHLGFYQSILISKENDPKIIEGIKKIIETRESIIADLLYEIETKKTEDPPTENENATNENKGATIEDEIKPKKGKYGIGLSGGGHRSALYHIGVLASLAENDMLRHIEVISCVSGGSIAGTFYYLCLKKLLEKKEDYQIRKEDYIKIIRYMQKYFKAGVQQNLRSRMFTNLFDNLKMMSPSYTRTHKMGELYETYFYKKAMQYDPGLDDPCDEEQQKSIPVTVSKPSDMMTMKTLIIEPNPERDTFDIQYDNWRRRNKIPQLVLNATCLNTGHNFQFAATWMGVPPGNMQPDIDVKPRLRRMYYKEAPKGYKDFRLGYAVAASSCVPAIFRAFPMKGLYQDMDVQLIDGGYHENQGVAAMLDQECKNLIISDGSGQLSTAVKASPTDLGVFYRADVVLQERVRELEFMDIKNRRYSSQLESIMIVHLRKDLTQLPRNWIDCNDPARKLIYNNVNNQQKDTNYGIEKTMQQKISEVRTDLDSFNDTECYMLMYDGYMQMNKEIADTYKVTTGKDEAAIKNWDFLAMTSLENKKKATQLMQFSNENAFKAFYYYWQKNAAILKIVMPLVVLLALFLCYYFFKQKLCTFFTGLDITTIIGTVIVIVALRFWKKVLHIILSFLKFFIFFFHIHTVDKYFISRGKINAKATETKPSE